MDLISFAVGLVAGSIVGTLATVLWMSLCFAAKRGDCMNDQVERQLAERKGRPYHG